MFHFQWRWICHFIKVYLTHVIVILVWCSGDQNLGHTGSDLILWSWNWLEHPCWPRKGLVGTWERAWMISHLTKCKTQWLALSLRGHSVRTITAESWKQRGREKEREGRQERGKGNGRKWGSRGINLEGRERKNWEHSQMSILNFQWSTQSNLT